ETLRRSSRAGPRQAEILVVTRVVEILAKQRTLLGESVIHLDRHIVRCQGAPDCAEKVVAKHPASAWPLLQWIHKVRVRKTVYIKHCERILAARRNDVARKRGAMEQPVRIGTNCRI